MLTLFAIPKPFDEGPVGHAQRNALASWTALDDVEVVLVGDEEGVAAAAAGAGVRHLGEVACSEAGTPRLDDALRRVDEVARHPLRCFVNADVVFLDDLLPALETLRRWRERWVAVGRTCDVALPPGAVGPDGWRDGVRARAREDGVLRGAGAIDWLVFPRDLYLDLPPFVVGRAGFDNWMVWHARASGVPVVDVTTDVLAVHQSHGYGHLADGKAEAYLGSEAVRNLELAGGKGQRYSLADASHRLRRGQALRNPWAFLRSGDRLRRLRWKLGLERTP